jgi:hypothetical protein
MSQMTQSPATTPIPVQLSEPEFPEFIAFIFPCNIPVMGAGSHSIV